MHTGYFTNWPPRVDTLDALGDLHHPRKSPSLLKKSTAPVSASAPSSPRAEAFRSQQGAAFDGSYPSSPTPPQRTATAPTSHKRLAGPRMTSRALSADSINTDALGFRNAIAGGLLTSPSGVPTNNYLPYLPSMISSIPSRPFDHPSSTTTSSPSSATSPTQTTHVITGGAAAAATGGSTHLISFGAPSALSRAPSGGRPPMVRSSSSKRREAQQRASHHPFGGISSSQLPRKSSSSSFVACPEVASAGTGVGTGTGTGTGTGATNRQGGGTSTEINLGGQWFQSSNLRKSVSAGKPVKKGLKSRLRKLRQRQGSSSREVPIAFTSGESDSEAAFEKEPDTIFNSGGITHRHFSPLSYKSSTSSRAKQPFSADPGLPPQPPHPFVGSARHSPLSLMSSDPGFSGVESQKESSAVRFKEFKELFKLSNQLSPSSTLERGNSHKNSKSLQIRSTFPDFFSGDDQPSHAGAFRMDKRRRRLTKKSRSLANGMPRPAITDDEDSPVPKSGGGGGGLLNLTVREGGSRHGGHKHPFLNPFHPRRRSRSTGEEGRQELEALWMSDATVPVSSVLSPALVATRQDYRDNTNVFVAELPRLPKSFVREFEALAPVSKPHGPYHPQTPSVSHITPSSTASSAMSPMSASQYYGSQNHVKLQQQLLLHQQQQQQQQQHLQQHNRLSNKAALAAFGSKTFLFQSLQNSKLQGYYIFRVVGDHVEYRKLPMGLNPLCAQYFRDTYVTYRGLEAKTKTLREEREKRMKYRAIWNSSQQRPADQGLHGVSEPVTATLSKFATKPEASSEISRITATREDPDSPSASEEGVEDILRSAAAWDTASPHHSASVRPQSSPYKRSTGYLEQRYNPEGTPNLALVKNIIGVPDRPSNKLDQVLIALEKRGLPRAGTKHASFSGPLSAGGMFSGNSAYSGDLASPKAVAGRPTAFIPQTQRPPLLQRKRSWTVSKDQQRLEAERRRLEEEERWNKEEQKHREEVCRRTYGPQLFLNEIVHEFDYERFEASAVITILNDNPDTAVFSIMNGDNTNCMRLESPHAKLKNEFLNRLAISRMGHGECDVKRSRCARVQREGSIFDQFMKMEKGYHDDLDDANEELDTLLEIADLRIALQEENLRSVREDIQTTMKEIEKCLDSLDHLNERAKKLMTDLIRAIDSQEVQLALRPSMTTGWTLAETVEWKLKDVNDRIVVCTRIMFAAKDNLNRLKYEIELEQRSIRLFRQYKIVIAVISFSIVFLVWSLYHSRASAMAPQPASPLFSTVVNPFEVDHSFHHGAPPILPSPSPKSDFVDVDFADVDFVDVDFVDIRGQSLVEEACPMAIDMSMEHLEL